MGPMFQLLTGADHAKFKTLSTKVVGYWKWMFNLQLRAKEGVISIIITSGLLLGSSGILLFRGTLDIGSESTLASVSVPMLLVADCISL